MSTYGTDRDEFIQSLARGLSVICAFQSGREMLTLTEVARHCDLTRAGARRILLTLEDLGYVKLDGRNFTLTSKVLELTSGYLGQTLWQRAQPIVERVAAELNETASAGVLEGFDIVYTVRVRSKRLIHLELQPGAHLPAHASALGRVLLAGLRDYELDRYMRQADFQAYTPTTICDPRELRAKLDQVRTHGWCFLEGEIDEGSAGVAVPLHDSEGNTIAGIGIGSNPLRANATFVHERAIPTLREAAATISAML